MSENFEERAEALLRTGAILKHCFRNMIIAARNSNYHNFLRATLRFYEPRQVNEN